MLVFLNYLNSLYLLLLKFFNLDEFISEEKGKTSFIYVIGVN